MMVKRKGQHLYYVVSAIVVLLGMGAAGIVDRLVYGEWEGKPGDKITQGMNLLMIVTSLILFRQAFRRKRIGAGGILALAVVGFLFLSAVWSVDPETTIRRGVVYLFVIIGAIGVVGSLDRDEVLDLLAMTCGLCAAASIVLLAISPNYVLMPDHSTLRGIFAHKNVLGQVMAVGALATLHGVRAGGRRRRLPKFFLLTLFVIVAFLSKSSTGMLTIFAFCAVSGLVALFRRGGTASILGVFAIMFLVLAAGIVALSPDSVLELLGKDPTLTGRLDLWPYVLNAVQQRPILGWGYSAFWLLTNPAAEEIKIALGWSVPEAHNGLLEMLLGIGIVGTALFIFLLIRNVALALRCINTSAQELAITSLLCCLGILLVGIAEVVLLEPNDILTSAFFMTGLMCERAVRATHRRRYPTALRRISPQVLPIN
jgi:exopolysaccharide production protein ExoQ